MAPQRLEAVGDANAHAIKGLGELMGSMCVFCLCS